MHRRDKVVDFSSLGLFLRVTHELLIGIESTGGALCHKEAKLTSNLSNPLSLLCYTSSEKQGVGFFRGCEMRS